MGRMKNAFQWMENKMVRSLHTTEINQKDTVTERYYGTKQRMREMSLLPTHNMVALLLTLFFISLDFVCIYQLVSAYMVETIFNSVMMSLGIAVTIDITPSILAGFVRNLSDKPREERKLYEYLGVIVIPMLFVFFVLMAFVRLNSQDIIFSTADTGLQSAINQVTQNMSDSLGDKGTLWMSYLFIFVPVATSIVTFVISLYSNLSDKEQYVDNVAKLALYDEVTELKRKELEARQLLDKNLSKRNLDLCKLEEELNRLAAETAKDLSRLELAKHTQDAQAADDICGGNCSGNI